MDSRRNGIYKLKVDLFAFGIYYDIDYSVFQKFSYHCSLMYDQLESYLPELREILEMRSGLQKAMINQSVNIASN